MKRTIGLMIVMVIALGSNLSACYLENTCSVDELYQPTDLNPTGEISIDDLTPQLDWHYPEGCNPESFVIEVSTGLTWAGERTLAHHAEVSGSERTIVVGPLLPGTHYYWIVYAVIDGERGPHAWGSFITGPGCAEADRASYTPPLLLSPAEGQVISDTTTITTSYAGTFTSPRFTFHWQNSMSCLPPEGFTVEYSDNSLFESRGPGTQRIYTGYETSIYDILWDEGNTRWYECLRMFWRVHIGQYEYGDDPYANIYATSETRSFLINTSGNFCIPDFGLILTPIPWLDLPVPGGESTTTPSVPPTATTLERANCRSGPALDYPILSILPAGQQFEVRGRNMEGDAWQVFDPDINENCWVNDDLVEVIGITDLVEIVIPPPPPLIGPTDTPPSEIVDCSQWSNDQPACISNPACEWNPNIDPIKPCINK